MYIVTSVYGIEFIGVRRCKYYLFIGQKTIIMISNDKIRPYIFGFLVFCVFSSKNIIIYNEETLVALSFFAFIFFVFRYFGDTIKQSLDERSEGIKVELQNFLHLKAQSLKQLYKEHQKVRT